MSQEISPRSSPAGSPWTFRELEPTDQDFLWDMLYIALWDPPDEPRRPRSVLENPLIQRFVEHWGRDSDDFALAACTAETGEPVGAVWTRLGKLDGAEADNDGCPFPEIGIGIMPEFQGQGLGSRLMEGFLESLRPRVPGLRLGVHPRNVAARRLYDKFGFISYAIGAGDYPQMKLEFRE